jgi:hypothetical protein
MFPCRPHPAPLPEGALHNKSVFWLICCRFHALNISSLLSILSYSAEPPEGEGVFDPGYNPPFLAFGKNSCWPSTRKSAIAFWPWSEISQSMNACPSLAFTWTCLAGLTRMTPY